MATATTRTSARSHEMFERIKNSIAGGESSYARLRAGIELCIDHTAGARMWDVDGNEYIDYCLGYGPLLFGHNPPGYHRRGGRADHHQRLPLQLPARA